MEREREAGHETCTGDYAAQGERPACVLSIVQSVAESVGKAHGSHVGALWSVPEALCVKGGRHDADTGF